LLRFKPAPMYILDEVDAALDLSHTQNIGIMLKTHFKNSQFIVVSLKEGMFNNANVIFRTQFIDGMSTVRRTIPAGAAIRDEEEVERMSTGGKKSGKRSRKGGRKAPLTARNR
jgi:structural maintenance of chromosome 2